MVDLGLRQPRLEGEEYLAIVDEFMEAVRTRWPKAIVQVCIFSLGLMQQLFFVLLVNCSDIFAVRGLANEMGL